MKRCKLFLVVKNSLYGHDIDAIFNHAVVQVQQYRDAAAAARAESDAIDDEPEVDMA